MKIGILQPHDTSLWDEFVLKHPRTSNYHRSGWRRVITDSFGHAAHDLVAKDDLGNIVGILPLVCVKSWLFGTSLVSVPFFNYGGVVADDPLVEEALLRRAKGLARSIRAGHIELRQTHAMNGDLRVKTHKVTMVLELPPSSERLWESFPSKLRSQIRRSIKEGMEVRVGGGELLEAFYRVFSIHMRDLGTPVYAKRFFEDILRVFPNESTICVVSHRGTPVAAGFLTRYRDTLEIPWAASLRRYHRLSPNMLLYWRVLEYACDHGFRRFDFGRCSVDGGTARFKAQWGAKPVPLYWYYATEPGARLPQVNVDNPKYRLGIAVWRKLPVWLASRLGPMVVRGIA